MRIKLTIFVLVLASLACDVVGSTQAAAPTLGLVATEATATNPPQPTTASALESRPLIVPEAISSFRMLDQQNGWMITEHSILQTADGGASWHDVTPPGVSAPGYGTGAAFLDSQRAWILVADPSDSVNAGTLYRTRDGGLNWTSNPVPFGSGDLHFLDEDNGWMMADLGVAAGSEGVAVFQTTDGGANWTQVYTNLPTDPNAGQSLPFGGSKSGITPRNMQEAWVTGAIPMANAIYLYHTLDGGHTWSPANVTMPPGAESAMFTADPPVFFDAQTGVLPTTAGSEGTSTLFFVTHDVGSTWTPTSAVAGSGKYTILSPNEAFVWFGNVLSVTQDGMQTWTDITPNVDLSDTLLQFQFVDRQNGWAASRDATGHTSLYRTADGGTTWIVLVP